MTPASLRRFLHALRGMGIDSYFFEKKGRPTLGSLKKEVVVCKKCSLAETRRHVVFGEGDPKTRLVFVGEAPGEEEDIRGRPFVGRAGKLLDEMINRIGLRREEVYICNVLKCRPPNNRDPLPDEVDACKEFLFAQLSIIHPRIICTLGRHAYNVLLNTDDRITKVRGRITQFRGMPLLPTYHPSFLLRNQNRIPEVWEDMDQLRQFLKLLRGERLRTAD